MKVFLAQPSISNGLRGYYAMFKALPPCDSTLAVHAVYREYTLSPITNLEL